MLKVADLSKLSARFGRFLPNYPGFLGVVRVVRVKIASRFRHWLFDTGDASDCGCALHAHGCYNGLVNMALFARQKVEKLLLHRRIRFETKFAKLAPDKLVEMSKALGPVLTSPTDVFFDYKAHACLVI